MSYNTAGPLGSSAGTFEGTGTMGHTTAVLKIIAYASSTYMYGLDLYWDVSTHKMYGQTNDLDPQELDFTDDPVKEIKYHVDATGYLRGLRFKTVSNVAYPIGFLSASPTTAFSNSSNEFTDLETYKGSISSVTTIWGATLYYTGPARLARAPLMTMATELAFPAAATLAHGCVVAKSLMKVGKLRGQLGIKAPSCDPPLTVGPSDSQLWYRTFRAQENCKEMFLVYLPSILIASTMGYCAFGKWVPRTVAVLAFVGAGFRYKYLKAYIEDADKRGPPFYYASLCMKPIFFIAVASCGYLIGKKIYGAVKGNDEEDEE